MNFKDQSVKWIQQLAARRKSIKPSTLTMYEAWLKMLPASLSNMELDKIDNGVMRGLVGQLEYSPASIQGIVGLVKRVIASAVDENGNELYPRKWNNDFIDLPPIGPQKQPMVSAQEIENILKSGIRPDMRALVVLLAGTGMRLGEALALKSSNVQDSRIAINSTMWRKKEQTTKTKAGARMVFVAPALVDVLNCIRNEEQCKEGYLFPYWPTTLYRQLNLPGFHSLRRFRVSWLRKQGVQESLLRYWIGHANTSITDRYDKIAEDTEYQKKVAEEVGLGFNL